MVIIKNKTTGVEERVLNVWQDNLGVDGGFWTFACKGNSCKALRYTNIVKKVNMIGGGITLIEKVVFDSQYKVIDK